MSNKPKFTFNELETYFNLGFALHWLRPNSKIPVKGGWTKGPREAFSDFKKSHKSNYNVGVRLGSASKLKDGFLAVVDVDIKSKDPKHRAEAEEALFKLFPQLRDTPAVHSGRGNGSAHYYVSIKTPISGDETKAESSESVKVKMPSTDVSNKERQILSEKEIKDGIRLRKAWSIALMSEGRQVVLPGSVHPDTGRLYDWADGASLKDRKIQFLNVIPTRTPKGAEKAAHIENPEVKGKRVFSIVDPNSLGLKPEQIEAIVSGEGVEDRSAKVFALCMALVQRGVSDSKIVSLFTDKRFFLGQVAFDHRKTQNRNAAADWVEKYCLKKAKEKVAASAFDHEVIEVPNVTAPSIPTMKDAPDWQRELDLQNGPRGSPPVVKATYKNLRLILLNELGPDLIRRNLFSNEDAWGIETPWGFEKGKKRSGGQDDTLRVKTWLIQEYQVEASVTMIDEALDSIAGENAFHPVKDLLESLEWDGVERVENAFETYLGAKMPREYQKAVTRKFFMALIARIYEPGIKFDYLPVFEGDQGIGKSSFGSILVGEEWHLDGLPDLADKDAALNLQGQWLIEMGELSTLYRSQLEAAKAFISRQTDKVRPPYGKRRVDFPRSCVFYGTTNARNYLTDPTGNRRYWPVKIKGCDFKKLKRDRLQLLAEAKFLFDFCREPLFLEGVAKSQALKIQESRRIEDEGDSMQAKLTAWLKKPEDERGAQINLKSFQLDELFEGPFFGMQKTMATRKTAGEVLRRMRFKRIHTMQGKRWRQ